MYNTYINDNSTSNYPFTALTMLPFPASCIAGLSVALHAKTALVPNMRILATAVDISSDVLTVTLATESGVEIGTVSTTSGSNSGSAYVQGTDLDANIFLTRGIVQESAIGSYAGSFYLDPACVRVSSNALWAYPEHISINGTAHQLVQLLSFRFQGMLEGSPSTADRTVFNVHGNVPYASKMTIGDTITDYNKVTSINGISVSDKGVLSIVTVAVPASGTAVSGNFVRYSVSNAVLDSQVVHTGDVEPYATSYPGSTPLERTQYWHRLNEERGDCTVLTVYGGKRVLNCYDPAKDNAPAMTNATEAGFTGIGD